MPVDVPPVGWRNSSPPSTSRDRTSRVALRGEIDQAIHPLVAALIPKPAAPCHSHESGMSRFVGGYCVDVTNTNTFARSLSDVGLAAWFGGTLANAVALNKAAGSAESGTAAAVADGWKAWTPVNLAAIGAHLVGSTTVLFGNKGRMVGQRGVGTVSVVRTGVLIAALGATAYSRILGQRVIASPGQPVSDGTTPTAHTDPAVANAQQQLSVLQWVIPGLTGVMLILNAVHGEQQRPTSVVRGVVDRIVSH